MSYPPPQLPSAQRSFALLTEEEDRHPIGYDVAGNASIEFEVLFPNVFYNFFHVDIFIYLLSMQVHIGKVTWATACT